MDTPIRFIAIGAEVVPQVKGLVHRIGEILQLLEDILEGLGNIVEGLNVLNHKFKRHHLLVKL